MSKFNGPVITYKNQEFYVKYFAAHFLNNIAKDEPYTELDEDGLKDASIKYAMLEISREKKHLKAFLKGKNSYRFKKMNYPVVRNKYKEDIHLSDIM